MEICPSSSSSSNVYELIPAHSFDGLPFLPEHFDFVHISWIGLGVPENEVRWIPEPILMALTQFQWQPLLEVCASFR